MTSLSALLEECRHDVDDMRRDEAGRMTSTSVGIEQRLSAIVEQLDQATTRLDLALQRQAQPAPTVLTTADVLARETDHRVVMNGVPGAGFILNLPRQFS